MSLLPIAAPPAERASVAWTGVVLWSLFIFSVVPAARTLSQLVEETWGRAAFGSIALALVVLGFGVCARAAWRAHRHETWTRHLGLVAIAVVFVMRVAGRRSAPEEAMHYVLYAGLGLLAFNALAHRVRDRQVYVSAFLVCALVGTLDELLQWITPRRFFEIGDVGLDVEAAALSQLGIALGLRPGYIHSWGDARSVALSCRLALALVTLWALCLVNTPPRVDAWASQIPGLAFLVDNPSVIIDYGHRYASLETGVFRSRLAPDELARQDRERATAAAAIVEQFGGADDWPMFVARWTSARDPFLHELRSHLYYRDYYHQVATNLEYEPLVRRRGERAAYHEDQIVERYFGATMQHTSHRLRLEPPNIPDGEGEAYESPIAVHLTTAVRERTVWLALFAIAAMLVVVERVCVARVREGR